MPALPATDVDCSPTAAGQGLASPSCYALRPVLDACCGSKARGAKLRSEMGLEINSLPSLRDTASPYNLTHDESKQHWILSVSFGTTTNPRHLQYKHETAEQAMQDSKPIAEKWADKVTVEIRTEPDRITFSGITTPQEFGSGCFHWSIS